MGNNITKVFQKLKNRIQAQLEEWNRQLFSRVGKETLIKLVAQTNHTHAMLTFRLPKRICSEINMSLLLKLDWKLASTKD